MCFFVWSKMSTLCCISIFLSKWIRTLRSIDGRKTSSRPIGYSECRTAACCCNLFENSSEHHHCWQRWLADQKSHVETSAKRVNSLLVLEIVAEVVLQNDFISTQQNFPAAEFWDSDAAHQNLRIIFCIFWWKKKHSSCLQNFLCALLCIMGSA